jgi:hypothetical protein
MHGRRQVPGNNPHGKILLTSELPKRPKSFSFRLLPVLTCPHLDPKLADFDIANLAYDVEINLTICEPCLGNPNANYLHSGEYFAAAGKAK